MIGGPVGAVAPPAFSTVTITALVSETGTSAWNDPSGRGLNVLPRSIVLPCWYQSWYTRPGGGCGASVRFSLPSPPLTSSDASPVGISLRSILATTVLADSPPPPSLSAATPTTTPSASTATAIPAAMRGCRPENHSPKERRSRREAVEGTCASALTVAIRLALSEAGGSTCGTERASAPVTGRSWSTSDRHVSHPARCLSSTSASSSGNAPNTYAPMFSL